MVKMTKCRSVVHPSVTRSGRQIPPPVSAASCFWTPSPHLTQRGILIDTGYSLKLGIFWVSAGLVMRHVGGQFWVNSEVK